MAPKISSFYSEIRKEFCTTHQDSWNNGGADESSSLPFPAPTGQRGQWRCLTQLGGWCCWLGLPVLLVPATGTSKELPSSGHHTAEITKYSPLPYNKPKTFSSHQKSSRRPTHQEISCLALGLQANLLDSRRKQKVWQKEAKNAPNFLPNLPWRNNVLFDAQDWVFSAQLLRKTALAMLSKDTSISLAKEGAMSCSPSMASQQCSDGMAHAGAEKGSFGYCSVFSRVKGPTVANTTEINSSQLEAFAIWVETMPGRWQLTTVAELTGWGTECPPAAQFGNPRNF